jgi:hypothetical protein
MASRPRRPERDPADVPPDVDNEQHREETMNKSYLLGTTLLALAAAPAMAGKPHSLGEDVTVTPTVDARLRYEMVDQANNLASADALTIRVRPGLSLAVGPNLVFLAEGEGTYGLVDDYNSTVNGKTTFSTVADPKSLEVNRLQVQLKLKPVTVTVGRQRINLDDQRFVGSVGWRQNEQTFDAVRGETTVGKIALDGTFAVAQRTIFGVDAGPRRTFGGNYVFLGAGVPIGAVRVKAFAYLLDYNASEPVAATSTQTYGLRGTGTLKFGKTTSLALAASFAIQSDYKLNPTNYSVGYFAAEATLTHGDYGLVGGFEALGSSAGKAFQTPLATLHKFNGWADMFLTTPGQGLQDYYLGGSAKFPKIKAIPGLNASVTFHHFRSDVGNQKFGNEWDAQIGFKVANTVNVLAKYADFDRTGIAKFTGDVSTRKFWLQAEVGL